MANPVNIFSSQDHIRLGDDGAENLKVLESFQPNNRKLALVLGERIIDTSLLEVSEALSLSLERWKVTNVWYPSPRYIYASHCPHRLILLCELGTESFVCLENILLQTLNGSASIYLR